MEHVPDVNHAIPDLELAVDIGGTRVGVQSLCIVEQHLVASDMNQHRRQAGEIRVMRRGERIAGVAAGKIGIAHLLQRAAR